MKKHILIFNMKGKKQRLSEKLMCAVKGGLYIRCTGLMLLEGRCVCIDGVGSNREGASLPIKRGFQEGCIHLFSN